MAQSTSDRGSAGSPACKPRLGVVLVAGLVVWGASVSAASAQGAEVEVPPGWYSGDTHVHLQLCDTDVDLTVAEVYAEMSARHLDVAAVQFWAKWQTPQLYLSNYAPLVTGVEDPIAQGDPAHELQFGVEVSGFPASQFGHLQALDIDTGFFPQEALYSAPILDAFGDQPGAVRGYAHVMWYEDYQPRLFFGGVGAAYLAPVDAALGAIDFLESARVTESGFASWRGLYYKLLNAGLRIGLSGGSDNSCFSPEIGDTRTYVQLGAEPLSYAAWCQGLKAGRTSIADGSGQFVDLAVEGVGIGGQVDLPAPGPVEVSATLAIASSGQTGTLRILRNGLEVAAAPYALPAGGSTNLSVPVLMEESGWLAARSDDGAHTAAVYVVVGDRPVAQAQDAEYWVAYLDAFESQIGVFNVPSVEPELIARLHAARQVFAALAAVDQPLPPGVATYGPSSPSCDGPIAIGVTAPPGQPFALSCLNAPPEMPGLLVIGLVPDPVGMPVLGMSLLIKVGFPYFTVPVVSSEGGYAQVPISVPSGKRFHAQFVWLNQNACGAGLLAASNGIDITVP